jgi:hypothetical protein
MAVLAGRDIAEGDPSPTRKGRATSSGSAA